MRHKPYPSHKFLGVYISNELKDDASIRHQCRNMYGSGNMIIRNFTQCSDAVKCQLFQSFVLVFIVLHCGPYIILKLLNG